MEKINMDEYCKILQAELAKYTPEQIQASLDKFRKDNSYEELNKRLKVLDKDGNEYPKGRFKIIPSEDTNNI